MKTDYKESDVLVTIGVPGKNQRQSKITTDLSKYIAKNLTFETIDYAKFSDKMVLATVALNKDNSIYILIPEEATRYLNCSVVTKP